MPLTDLELISSSRNAETAIYGASNALFDNVFVKHWKAVRWWAVFDVLITLARL